MLRIIFLLLLTPLVLMGQTIVEGDVSGRWDLEGSPFIVTDNVTIPQGERLIIEPGVEVRFEFRDDLIGMLVKGRLEARGTSEDSIYFTSNMENPIPGDWNQIKIDSTAIANFSYASITYPYRGLYYDYARSGELSHCLISEFGVQENFRGGFGMATNALYANYVDQGIIISDCVITNGGFQTFGIWANQCDLVLINSIISNIGQTGISTTHHIESNWNITISGCEITQTSGISLKSNTTESIEVINCRINDSGGGIVVERNCPIRIEDNDIYDLRYQGISFPSRLYAENEVIIKNNRIHNCPTGIKVGSEGWRGDEQGLLLDIQFNTIAFTQFPLIMHQQYPSPVIRNNIFACNDVQVMYYRNLQHPPDQDYNLFWNQGLAFEPELRYDFSVCYGDNDIFADPLFTDENDLHLRPNSPAINRADPELEVGDEPQPHGARANLGGYGTTVEAAVSPEEPLGGIPALYPLEFNLYLTPVNTRTDTTFFIMNSGDQPVQINSLILSDSTNFSIVGFEGPVELDPFERIEDLHLIFSPTVADVFQVELLMQTNIGDLVTEVHAVSTDREILSGEISGRLTAENSPYIVQQMTTVNERDSLIIESGVTIQFMRWAAMECDGDLTVRGEPTDSVKFTAFAGEPFSGIWRGIACRRSVNMDYTVVEYGKFYAQIDRDFEDDSISITNSSFRFADLYSPEISVWAQSVNLEHIICNNSYGGLRLEQYDGQDNLYINHLTSVYNHIGIYITRRDPLEIPMLKNSISAFNDRGILGYANREPFIVKNCLIFDNRANDQFIELNGLFEDPQFLGTPHFPFHLATNSPCINSGDEDDPRDDDGTVTDVGALTHRVNDIEPELDYVYPRSRECWAVINQPASFLVDVYDPDASDVHDLLWTINDTSFYASDSIAFTFTERGRQIVEVIAIDGHYWSNRLRWDVDVLLGVEGEKRFLNPGEFGIISLHPNPFNSAITIAYNLPLAGEVKFSIHDLQGREIAVLQNGIQSAGLKKTIWNAGDQPSGLYLGRIESKGQVATTKLTLVR